MSSIKHLFLISCLFISLVNTNLLAQQNSQFSIYFDSKSFEITKNEEVKLHTFLRGLDSVSIKSISIQGYCDYTGDALSNIKLSNKRAEALRTVLVHFGIKESLIKETIGKGALPSQNVTAEEKAIQRKSELVVNYEKTVKPLEVVSIDITPSLDTIKNIKESPILSDNQKVGDKITLGNILFMGGRHVILKESYKDLNLLKNALIQNKKYHVVILGHVCCMPQGEDGYDHDTKMKNLSYARAKFIFDYLIANGISSERLTFKGMKADYPTGKGDKADKRVEIEITKVVSE